MPTPSGLPKAGERWRRTVALPPDWKPHTVDFVVLERGSGSYWSLRVNIVATNDPAFNAKLDRDPRRRRQLWVDPAHWYSRGQLQYVGPA